MYVARIAQDADARTAARRAADLLRQHTGAVPLVRDMAERAGGASAADETWCTHTAAEITRALQAAQADVTALQQGPTDGRRLALQALGDWYVHAGDFAAAMAQYDAARDVCGTPDAACEVALRALDAAWCAGEPERVLLYADHATTALQAQERASLPPPASTSAWRAALAQGSGMPRQGAPTPGALAMRDARDGTPAPAPRGAATRARVGAFQVLARWALVPMDAPLPAVDVDEDGADAYDDILGAERAAGLHVAWALSADSAAQRGRAAAALQRSCLSPWAEGSTDARHALQAYLASDWAALRSCCERLHTQWAQDPLFGAHRAAQLHTRLLRSVFTVYLAAFETLSLATLEATWGDQAAAWLVEAAAPEGRIDVARQVWVRNTPRSVDVARAMDELRDTSALHARMAWTRHLAAHGVVLGQPPRSAP